MWHAIPTMHITASFYCLVFAIEGVDKEVGLYLATWDKLKHTIIYVLLEWHYWHCLLYMGERIGRHRFDLFSPVSHSWLYSEKHGFKLQYATATTVATYQGFWSLWNRIVTTIVVASAAFVLNFSQYQRSWHNRERNRNLKLGEKLCAGSSGFVFLLPLNVKMK